MSNFKKQLRNYNEGRVGTTVHTDLIFCVITIILTMIGAYIVNHQLVTGDQPFVSEFFAGVVHAIIYLQVLTLIVLALSYLSSWINLYRGLLMNLLPIVIYLGIRWATDPDPVAIMYSWGAVISATAIMLYKLKTLIHFLYATVFIPAHLSSRIHRSPDHRSNKPL